MRLFVFLTTQRIIRRKMNSKDFNKHRKEFFEETDEPVEQKDYLEEFFKELEIEDDETSESKNT